MSLVHNHPWEMRLLDVAEEAFNSHTHTPKVAQDDVALAQAYWHCEQLTRDHSKTFYVASALLPKAKRQAARALYAFCRVTDDLVDRTTQTDERINALNAWRAQVLAECPEAGNAVCVAWHDTYTSFNIPRAYMEQLIDGCATDIHKTRYQTFDELAEYAYGVASTVGLMAMHIIGYQGQKAMPYAIKLGVALQITNILRDVGEDYRNGRVYLPQEELEQFGIREEDLAQGRITDAWRAFMAFQIARNRQLYAESIGGIALLHPNGRFAIAAAARLYEAILTDIEAHDYDVFTRRASLSKWRKLSRLPMIWWQSRRARLDDKRGEA